MDPDEDWCAHPDGSERGQNLAPPLRPAPPRRSSTRARAATGAASTRASLGGGGEAAHRLVATAMAAGGPAALGSAWACRDRGNLGPLVVKVWRDGNEVALKEEKPKH